jgi:putative DNA primase/helicase
MIKETTGAITLIPENIPEELTERPQWVCWRLEERDGKMTKIPYNPYSERSLLASTTDLMTWDTFRTALSYYEQYTTICPDDTPLDGIGFVFCSADPFVGIDLDNCRNAESGEIAPWAQKIISRVQEGYMEASPSGTGIHIIVEGTARDGGTQKKVRAGEEVVGKIEIYSRERFFTITGHVL